MRLVQTIAFRLFLIIASIQTVALILLAIATINIQQSHLMENVELSAQRMSDIITRSTRYSMLLNRKEEVQHIIASVGGEPGIEGIRIYNKAGEVMFATVASDIHSAVDVNAEACISCHSGGQLDNPLPSQQKLSRVFSNPNSDRVLGLITPIRNEKQCSDAECHAHPVSKTILGVVDVKMSLAQVDRRLNESKAELLKLSVAAAFFVALASGAFIWLVIKRPVRKLVLGMQMISTGKLTHRIDADAHDEFGLLGRTFNKMSEDLELARQELTAWSNTLEQKVKAKTADLEIAHRQLVRAEKMSSLGNLAASVAHELNNPLEGILTFAKLIIKRIKKSTMREEDAKNYCEELQLVADEALRCGNIVKNLLVFSRQSGGSFQQVHLTTLVDRCVLLMTHHAKIYGVQLFTENDTDDLVECDANQIQQALLALLVNAVEAMEPDSVKESNGRIRLAIERSQSPDNVLLRVADNGVGMSEEVKSHIFEPFFTTKSEGKGVGLGLAIVYGIVERHQGQIDVESEIGKGTTFTITLPRKQPEQIETRSLAPLAKGTNYGKE